MRPLESRSIIQTDKKPKSMMILILQKIVLVSVNFGISYLAELTLFSEKFRSDTVTTIGHLEDNKEWTIFPCNLFYAFMILYHCSSN